MPKVFTSKTQQTGEIGESVAVRFLVKQGFTVVNRNYTKKWGEIDIVAEKDQKIHFIEVKSVVRENLNSVSHETTDYRPEDNMHPWKQKRLSRTVQTYLLSEKVPEEKEWQVDLILVFLNLKDRKARVKLVNDLIL